MFSSKQVFSCEYCENFKNNYFVKHLRTAASVHLDANAQQLKNYFVAFSILQMKRN